MFATIKTVCLENKSLCVNSADLDPFTNLLQTLGKGAKK